METRGRIGGTLRIVVWKGYDDASRPFCEAYGVSVQPTYVDDDEKTLTILKAGGVGRIDLVALDNRYLPLLIEADLLSPLDYARLPNSADYLDAFTRLVSSAPDGRIWLAPYIWGSHPMAYNSTFVREPPGSWLDVLKHEYRGKVVMLDRAIHQVILWGGVLGYKHPTRITRAQLDAVVDLLIEIKHQTRASLAGWDDIPKIMARGDAWIATAGWEAISTFAAQEGADVRLAHPKEGGSPWMDGWCIPRSAPNTDTAYAWIDFMIGPEAQASVARSLPSGTVNRKAIELLEPHAKAIFPYDDLDTLFAKASDFDLPPREPTDNVTTLADWKKAWERLRAA